MNGDRLKILEQGFLEGNLTPEEETELKQLVDQQDDHHLSTYFQWTGKSENLDVPDMRQRVQLNNRPLVFLRQNLLKIAATFLLLMTALFLFRPQLLDFKSAKSYSQVEIDQSYKATIETLSAMASFLNKGIEDTERCMDISAPFKDLNTLDNIETQEQ